MIHLRVLLFGLAVTLAASATAHAHATLVGSDPADGAVVATWPDDIRLTFNEPVSPLVMRWIGPDGSNSEAPSAEGEGTRALSIAGPPGGGDGTFLLSWRVVSSDGHPIGGSLTFSVGARSSVPASLTDDGGSARAPLLWSARVVLYLGLFAGVGGAVFAAFVGPMPARARTLAQVFLLAGSAGLVVALALQGLDALDAPIGGVLDPAVWRAGFATSYGWTVVFAALALGGGWLVLASGRRPSRRVGGAALACVGLALAASGHASAADPQWLMRPAVFLHALVLCLWLGALIPLFTALHPATPASDAAEALRGFSRIIPVPLVILLATGIVLASVQLGVPGPNWLSPYAGLLAVKLVLVLVLLALAAANRFMLTARAAAGDGRSRSRMRRSIAAEIVLSALILGVVAGWRFTPPPRAMAATENGRIETTLRADGTTAALVLSRRAGGRFDAELRLEGADGMPLEAREVALAFTPPLADIEPLRRNAARHDDGAWRTGDLFLPVPGQWRVGAEILIDDFEMKKLEGSVALPSPD